MAVRAVPDGDEYDKDVALAIRYAADNGAKVMNASFGKSYSPKKQWVYDAIIYAGTRGGNLFKSVDQGNTWNRIATFESDIWVVTIDPNQSERILIGTEHDGVILSNNSVQYPLE